MKDIVFLLRCLTFIFVSMLIINPSYSIASEAEILRRLERLEKEINELRDENAALRKAQGKEEKEKETETVRLKKAMEADRQELEDLIRCQGWCLNLPEDQFGTVMGKYDMRIYGRVKVDMNFDTAEFWNEDWVGCVKAGGLTNNSTNINPRDTRIGFKISRRDGDWTSVARIETDFYGGSHSSFEPRARLAYLQLLNHDWASNLIIGQDWNPVAQLNPPTIDFGILSTAGNLWQRRPQVTLRKKLGNFEILGSALNAKRTDTTDEDRMPWVFGRIAYNRDWMGKGGYLALGGGVKHETLTANAFGDNSVTKWLLALEMKQRFGNFIFAAEPWIGEGLGSDFVRYMDVNNEDTKKPYLIRGVGGFASMSYLMNSKHSFSLGYGIDDPKDGDLDGMTLGNNKYTKNQIYFLNTWYSLTKALRIGAEIMHLETERKNTADEDNHGTRYTFSAMYAF